MRHQQADLIITNANVITLDRARPGAETVAVQGDRIVFVGGSDEAVAWHGAQTRVIDGAGCTLLPGLIDSHFHLLWGSLKLDHIQCEGITDYASLTNAVQTFAAAHPERKYLLGYGLGYTILPDGAPLTRHHLD
ncbi:MAG: amidohydrolase family protein, partial [Chloroflexota bacterium]|nr:amidohydrolase family protein [Chloroflexota bacterium]